MCSAILNTTQTDTTQTFLNPEPRQKDAALASGVKSRVAVQLLHVVDIQKSDLFKSVVLITYAPSGCRFVSSFKFINCT